jgi:hypothetical protein
VFIASVSANANILTLVFQGLELLNLVWYYEGEKRLDCFGLAIEILSDLGFVVYVTDALHCVVWLLS